ncbi:MAG: response regulator transcription factor [Planctomycetes bacterium]|nr:response regulator transcription factor [Planctomycetota bacterium]
MKILIIEDEKKIVKYLKQGLEEHSYAVDIAHNGIDGLHLATHENYDLMILDIMLPGINGKEILKHIRNIGIHTPVIFLTAIDSVNDKVNGLDIGADDYIVKPFSFPELLARIRACMRRRTDNYVSFLKTGNLTLDPKTRKVFRDKQKIELTPVEFSILEYFMRSPGQILTRTMISEHIWDHNYESFSNVIDVHISHLRNKLEKDFNKNLIHTVRRVGYVLEERD